MINDLSDINYKSPEGRLLLTALTILTTHNYTDKTPGEVIGILNEKSSFLDDEKNKSFEERIKSEMDKLNTK